jgi:hypothetical protein
VIIDRRFQRSDKVIQLFRNVLGAPTYLTADYIGWNK